jgi:hypothetical protein
VLAGPIASGRSSVARALAERLHKSGRTVAVLDLDDVVSSLSAPSHETALDRVAGDPDRDLSKDEDFLRRAHDRFPTLRHEIPAPEWTFDTTAVSADECASVIANALAKGRTT